MGENFPFSKTRLRWNGLERPIKFNLILWFYNQQCTYVLCTRKIKFRSTAMLAKKTIRNDFASWKESGEINHNQSLKFQRCKVWEDV